MNKGIIIQSGNQIDSQHKPSAAIAVSFRQYPKDFQMPNNVFDNHALGCQLPVELFLFLAQFAAFRLFERCPRVFVQCEQALITAVAQTLDRLRQISFAVFEKRKIVSRSFGKTGVNNLPGFQASPHLGFYGVPLFLARIISLLFFFDGRSIGDSTTSTTMT